VFARAARPGFLSPVLARSFNGGFKIHPAL
jgi:hypothetical protein